MIYTSRTEDGKKSVREKEQAKLADLLCFSPFETAGCMLAGIYFLVD